MSIWREEPKVVGIHMPRIVCLCGSTRFYQKFMEANYEETMRGRIVLSVGFYPHAVNEVHGEGVGITPDQKETLDELHKRKIDLADEVYVLNVGGYIGASTRGEIEYAKKLGKPLRWLEPQYICTAEQPADPLNRRGYWHLDVVEVGECSDGCCTDYRCLHCGYSWRHEWPQ